PAGFGPGGGGFDCRATAPAGDGVPGCAISPIWWRRRSTTRRTARSSRRHARASSPPSIRHAATKQARSAVVSVVHDVDAPPVSDAELLILLEARKAYEAFTT